MNAGSFLRRAAIAFPVLALVLAGCGGGGATVSPVSSAPPAPAPATGAAPWALPSDPMKLVQQAGLIPQTAESFQYHVHAHLDVFVNGQPMAVPGGIGIDTTDPAVRRFTLDGAPGYGWKSSSPCPRVCISPLHTHDVRGVIHIEAPASLTQTLFTLGRLFKEWGVRLDRSCVGGYCSPAAAVSYYVDGKPYTGDPATMLLTDHEEIAIVIGSPPQRIPASFAFDPSEP